MRVGVDPIQGGCLFLCVISQLVSQTEGASLRVATGTQRGRIAARSLDVGGYFWITRDFSLPGFLSTFPQIFSFSLAWQMYIMNMQLYANSPVLYGEDGARCGKERKEKSFQTESLLVDQVESQHTWCWNHLRAPTDV